MGFIPSNMVDERLAGLAREAERDAALKRSHADAFCDASSLDNIVKGVKNQVLHAFARMGAVQYVILYTNSVESDLHHDEECERTLLDQLRLHEPNTDSVRLLFYPNPGDDLEESPRIYVTFNPPLGSLGD